MTPDQNRRLFMLSLLGGIGAFLTVFMIVKLFMSDPAVTSNPSLYEYFGKLFGQIGVSAGLGSFAAIQVTWRVMIRRGAETRKRGAIFGALAGLLAVFMTGRISNLLSIVMSLSDPVLLPSLGDVVFGSLFTSGLFLMFGGFLAPVFGAVLGFLFTKKAVPAASIPTKT